MSIIRRISILTRGLEVKCPSCFLTSSFDQKEKENPKLVCKHCGDTLPLTSNDYYSGKSHKMYGLIGAKNSGKTHYMTSMLGTIKNTGFRHGWSLQGLNDRTMKRFDNDYEAIFIDKTTVGFSDTNIGRQSLTYLLRIKGYRSPCLNFYDTAGESLSTEKLIERQCEYVVNSDALTLLLDPLQLPGVRDKIGSSVPLPERELSADDIISRVANTFLGKWGGSVDKKINIPISIVFSKIDLLAPLLPAHSPLRQAAGQEGGFDKSDFIDVDSEIRSLLLKWGASNIISQAEGSFKHVGFSGVSALGCTPAADGSIPKLNPMRILDPLMWQLHHHKNVKKAN